ncbi:NAD(P)-binding protein [Photorhabdus cinerea]|nr:NAD(P)-binding protein [Photorhabdus cinerea]
MNKRKFLVIGGAGVVGACLVRLLVADGHHVVVIDKRAAPGEHW